MAINLSNVEAEEIDFVGTLPDDWAWTDRLAAELRHMRRMWKSLPGQSLRNATQRAHNLRLLAETAMAWAAEIEALEAKLDAESSGASS